MSAECLARSWHDVISGDDRFFSAGHTQPRWPAKDQRPGFPGSASTALSSLSGFTSKGPFINAIPNMGLPTSLRTSLLRMPDSCRNGMPRQTTRSG